MTEFLRDLSPQRAHEPTRAVAVLPSAFEAWRPLRTARREPGPGGHAEEPSLTESPANVRPSARTAPLRSGAASPAVPANVRMPAPGGQTEKSPPTHVENPASGSTIAEPLAATTAAPALSTQAAHHAASVGVTRPIATAAAPVAELPASTPSRFAGVTHRDHDATASPFVSRPAARISEAPMSARALAARPAQLPDQRPIVHVTIDRIEVRAPSLPERSRASSRARSSSPHVSLNEYLRARKPERRGGAS